MDPIPNRKNLESMSRIDIQKLCKVNNIKANMRTDEMINALCDQVSGKEVPRPHRSTSERVVSQPPRSRLSSVQPPMSKTTEISVKKTALQPSESNTDAESVADVPVSAPTTRRKAKDLQVRLGKGRPVLAGGSGARNITRVSSRASGRRAKVSAMLQEDPIPEEEEGVGSQEGSTNNDLNISNENKVSRPSSVRPLSPIQHVAPGLPDEQLSHLPTPTPSHPSYSLPSIQLSALESRIIQLETPNLDARLSLLESAVADLPNLKASVAQIPILQDEIQRLVAARQNLEADVVQWKKMHAELKNRTASLEVHAKGLVVENGALKERVTELEEKLQDHGEAPKDTSMSSVVIHSPGRPDESEKDKKAEATILTAAATPKKRTIHLDDLPDPSPSQPTLGKRARSETPDASLTDIAADGGTRTQRQDAELEAIYRVIRPQRKKQRLHIDVQDDMPPLPFFKDGPGGPSSTSTPQQRRSDPALGFFTEGRPAPTPLPRTQDGDAYLCLDKDESVVEGAGASRSGAIAGPSNHRATSSLEAAPRTPSQTAGGMPTSGAERGRGTVDIYDPAFFSSLPPVFYPQSSHLPFPLNPAPPPTTLPFPMTPTAPSTALPGTPSTPPNARDAQDILERSTQFATPTLGEPWRFEAMVTPDRRGDSVEPPATQGGGQSEASSSTAPPPGSSRNYTFRAGGRRERDDRYNPYLTPPRAPGASPRTGITPTRRFSISLRSPPTMETVPEVPEPDSPVGEDGVARSPPDLKTLYGTELEGDTRFGDFGKDLGRYEWHQHPEL